MIFSVGARIQSTSQFSLFIFFTLVLLPSAMDARPDADSLMALLHEAADDTSKVLLLDKLAKTLIRKNPQTARSYILDALSLAKRLKWAPGIAELSNTQGALNVNMGQYKDAATSFQRSLSISDSIGDRTGAARALRNLGVVYRKIGNNTQALEYTGQSMRISDAEGDTLSYVTALLNIGTIYNEMEEYDQALEAFSQCETVAGRLDYKFGISIAVTGMGEADVELGELSKALACC